MGMVHYYFILLYAWRVYLVINDPTRSTSLDRRLKRKPLDGRTGLHPSLKGILDNLPLPRLGMLYEIRFPSFFT